MTEPAALRKQFSADIAHELRTPLNILRAEAEVALARARTPEEYRDLIGSGLEEYQRLSRLVERLLFLARAEHDAKQIQKKKLDARTEALAVCAFYEAWAIERGSRSRWSAMLNCSRIRSCYGAR